MPRQTSTPYSAPIHPFISRGPSAHRCLETPRVGRGPYPSLARIAHRAVPSLPIDGEEVIGEDVCTYLVGIVVGRCIGDVDGSVVVDIFDGEIEGDEMVKL